ncbi:MAG: T9SS type A sorting domain-containing protein [Bacteroidetes bacterium]|nr:T9SS type A sorting domain-containing protein [Bacteroidota bacterium]
MNYRLFTALIFGFSGFAQAQDTWIQRDSVNGSGKSSGAVFALNDDAYFLTGLDQFGFKRSMVSYDISQNDWDDEISLGGETGDGLNRGSAIAFSAGGFGFCGLGTGSVDYFKDLWKFDPVTNVWTQMADFEGTGRREAVSFTVGENAYVGTGQDEFGLTNDFWKYDYLTNDWIQIADFPGTPRRDAVAISMGGQGYVGTGIDASTYLVDFWAYYPLTDTWLQRADFPGTPRHGSVGFGLFPTAFIATGEDNTFTYKKDTWEYNYFSNTWTQRSNFPGPGRAQAIAIVVKGRAFVGTGYNGTLFDDFYEYTPMLSVDEELNLISNLYPNPASTVFYLNLANAQNQPQVQLFNETGQDITSQFEISQPSPTQLEIRFNNIARGLYYVSVKNDAGYLSTKSILIQ